MLKKIYIFSFLVFGLFFIHHNSQAFIITGSQTFNISCDANFIGTNDCGLRADGGPYQVYRWEYREGSSDVVNIAMDVCITGSGQCKHIAYKAGFGTYSDNSQIFDPSDWGNYTGIEVRNFTINPPEKPNAHFEAEITFWSRQPDPAPAPGTINVSSNIPSSWVVSGPNNYSGSGT